MKAIKKLFTPDQIISWSVCLYTSLAVLPILIVLNFYGLYSNQFYLLKFDNFIFPILTILHFIYLYAIQFKIREGETADPQLRNVEYGMYAILFIYAFKTVDTLYILMSFDDYDAHIIPDTFLPVGIFILAMQLLLIGMTLSAFYFRKTQVGPFNFDQINENIDFRR